MEQEEKCQNKRIERKNREWKKSYKSHVLWKEEDIQRVWLIFYGIMYTVYLYNYLRTVKLLKKHCETKSIVILHNSEKLMREVEFHKK